MKNALPQQVQLGSAISLALDQFCPTVLPFTLGFLSRGMLHHVGNFGVSLLYLADEPLDRGVTVAISVIYPEVLPDALSRKPFGYRSFDQLSVWLSFTLGAGGRFGRF